MSLLIDGYNLLNAVGIIGYGAGASSLERSRLALLNFLAESLPPAELPSATVVFDAGAAPRGLPRVVEHRGLTVRFAVQYEDADSLLEELILADTAPRRLTVVSSDHRIQRAARRRRARAVDSDVWYAELLHRRQAQVAAVPSPAVPAKPYVPLLEEEVQRWLRDFGGESLMEKLMEEEQAAEAPPAPPPSEAPPSEKPGEERAAKESPFVENPFPPGYAEDLLEEEDFDNPFPPGYGEDLEEK